VSQPPGVEDNNLVRLILPAGSDHGVYLLATPLPGAFPREWEIEAERTLSYGELPTLFPNFFDLEVYTDVLGVGSGLATATRRGPHGGNSPLYLFLSLVRRVRRCRSRRASCWCSAAWRRWPGGGAGAADSPYRLLQQDR